MPKNPKTVREIPFTEIEENHQLASYWFGRTFCPAVDRRDGGGFQIRILKNERPRGGQVTTSYDYFELDEQGTVEVAPRGFARDYKPGRVVGLAEAIEKYAAVSR
ncbi:hypothetical protein AB0N38_26435 [Micromonospora aurantiaca]|uniref:hypothetical protein n=1 Tax=Micromonospora aurantiaca (nom. illeg.) TaxID=47850 RepID=UPI003442EEC9